MIAANASSMLMHPRIGRGRGGVNFQRARVCEKGVKKALRFGRNARQDHLRRGVIGGRVQPGVPEAGRDERPQLFR
jgi:hypothetical protein